MATSMSPSYSLECLEFTFLLSCKLFAWTLICFEMTLTGRYVDPVVERLNQKHCIRYRLSRSATRYVDGKHYRDLSTLNRDPSRVLYVSGHVHESTLQPGNGVPIKPWKGEPEDTALLDLIPFLEYVAKARPTDIRAVLASYQSCDIAKEFIERSKEHQKRMQEQKQQGRFWRR